ncbi:MAG: NAD(P)-dependent oxidoreductase [Gammaproteobacteria bacterium]|nr:NAD(P)-dependent oxidoreductase [Gammaproteobacteria bacterium]
MSHSIVVTGATGFVGSHVLEELTQIGHKDLHIIAACRDRRKLIAEFSGEVREGDLRDPEYMHRVLTGADIVCHCAAWSAVWGKKKESKQLYLDPSLQLIDKALEWRVKRFINISTTSAAAPKSSSNAYAPGISHRFWPHLNNIIAIENYMQENAHRGMSMVNLRLGIFAGSRYSLGILPLLLPRLKTHLVPWVSGGKTGLPIIDGRDIGQAFVRAALAPQLPPYAAFNIVGPEIPTVREVIDYIGDHFDYPRPHFSVPFFAAYGVAWLMERLDPLLPWEPLITRSIVHLLEETGVSNNQARELLGYNPEIHWKEAVHRQITEMQHNQFRGMKMFKPIKSLSIGDKES